MKAPSPALLQQFAVIVGPQNAVTGAAELEPYLVEPRGLYHGSTPVVLRPGNTAEVSAILKLAQANGIAVVPQGGNTGMVGGQIPDASGAEIIVNLGRMNRIRKLDAESNTVTVEAGVILQTLQEAADAADRLFPLSLSAEGSAQIGGNIATNAGGTAVLAYGNTRDLVLGLEVVLANGEVWDGLRTLRKDNTGYDLKHLFIGAEGTLGIITGAVLKLFPKPKGRSVAFAGLASPHQALRLFGIARSIGGPNVTACELMSATSVGFLYRNAPQFRDPLAGKHAWYLLLEISSSRSEEEARALIEEIFVKAFEDGVAEDAVLAESLQQSKDLWHIRHALSDIQKAEGGSIKHDISVPVASMPAFLEEATALVEKMVPGCRPAAFGHMGDGNIHFNISQPVGADKQAYLARWDEMNDAVHAIASRMGGSISAEHGIGALKRHALPHVKSGVEMGLMRSIKGAFDPAGILNPGKVL
jgi:FAD/FMN-containing dehydrogenase